MDQTSPHSTFPPFVVWLLISAGAWAICSDIGQLISGLISSFFANPWQVAGAAGLESWHWSQRLTIILRQIMITTITSGLILGIGTGLIQAAFLRTYEVPRRRWLIASCVAWSIVSVLDTWRIYGAISYDRWLFAGGLLLASSAVLATTFWLILRHYLPQAQRWAIAGVLGYALSTSVGIVQSAIIFASVRGS